MSNAQAKIILEERIKESLHTNAKLKIEIMAFDMEKGIISVTVTEEYTQMNGITRTESVSKTAIMERTVGV